MLKYFVTFLLLVIFVGCGYQPSAGYTNNIFSGAVFVEVDINRVEPENGPFLIDELTKIIITRFDGSVGIKEQAVNKIKASYEKIVFVPLAYDRYGYIISYRTDVTVKFVMINKTGKSIQKEITSSAYENSNVNSLNTTELRRASIREALGQGVNEFMAYVTLIGTK